MKSPYLSRTAFVKGSKSLMYFEDTSAVHNERITLRVFALVAE